MGEGNNLSEFQRRKGNNLPEFQGGEGNNLSEIKNANASTENTTGQLLRVLGKSISACVNNNYNTSFYNRLSLELSLQYSKEYDKMLLLDYKVVGNHSTLDDSEMSKVMYTISSVLAKKQCWGSPTNKLLVRNKNAFYVSIRIG